MYQLTSHVQLSRGRPGKFDKSFNAIHLLFLRLPSKRDLERDRGRRGRESVELVRDDDAKVGASTSERPEEVRIVGL